jgi:GGDEF domain-containing protein
MLGSDRVQSKTVEREEFHLTVFSTAIIAIFAAAIAAFMYPTVLNHSVAFGARTSLIFFIGFCVLCALLLGYIIERQIVVRRLRAEIIEAQARYSELQQQAGHDMLATLSGFNHFQDRLVMEYKRAVNCGDSLSIAVVLLSPAAELPDEGGATAAVCDAVKAIARKLRREDSLYHFSGGAFGIMMPGVRVKEAHVTAARLAEGLADAAGAVQRFVFEIKVFNYPQTAATAHELEQAVRSLLPKELVSEPSIADSFVDSFDLKM